MFYVNNVILRVYLVNTIGADDITNLVFDSISINC